MAPVDATPDAKSRRYDRQIRIWGAHGQQRLESCRVALLNSGPTGSETLKNLALAGIAAFTVVDGARVTASDLGNNFMISASSLGESRAKCVTELLKELNDGVAGSYVEEEPETLIETNPQFFSSFSLIVATQMRETDVVKLDTICREYNVPLLVARSYGLVGYVRPSLPEHRVVESKPDTQLDDLRLHTPFPELQALAASFDLDSVDELTHKHIPFALLLVQASARWRSEHEERVPSTSKERAAFKEMVAGMKRSIDGCPIDEENFDEALKAAFHVWTPYAISSEVRRILGDGAASGVTAGSDEFWVIVAALQLFVANEGQGFLPLEGSIPDMHATTALYLRVQQLYREKAERDVAAVEAHVHSVLTGLGRDAHSVRRDTIKLYCKNARSLRVVRYRSLAEETTSTTARGSVVQQALANETSAPNACLYVLLRAADRFHAAHGRYPGSLEQQTVEDDVPTLKALANQVMGDIGSAGSISDDYVVEMCRFGAAELHVIAAFVGGMAAQEAIKLITHQFTPVAGVLVYNAIAATTTVFEV